MKLSLKTFALFALCAAALSAAISEPPKGSENRWARKSGNFKDTIWFKEKAAKAEKSAAPTAIHTAVFAATNGKWVINSKEEVWTFAQRANNTSTTFQRGADFTTCWFFGQRGSDNKMKGYEGSFEIGDGATFNVKERFVLAGNLIEDSGTGTFSQKGGTVNVGGQGIYLTGRWPMTSSAKAVGFYGLQGGSLNINCTEPNEPGLTQGTGNGIFSWQGGTLNASHVGMSIANTGTGNLSPGGDEKIATMRLAPIKESKESLYTYTQATSAKMTVNVAGRSSLDQVNWTTPDRKGRAVFEAGTTFELVPVKNYKPKSGDSYSVFIADDIELRGDPVIKCEGSMRTFKAQVTGNIPKRLQIVCE